MNPIEIVRLVGIVLVVLAVIILVGTYAAIRYHRAAGDADQWVAEQQQDAAQWRRAKQADIERRQATLPTIGVARTPGIDKEPTRPMQVPVQAPMPLLEHRPVQAPAPPTCGDRFDHVAHYFIEYGTDPEDAEPTMTKRPCPGVRSGPHRRRA